MPEIPHSLYQARLASLQREHHTAHARGTRFLAGILGSLALLAMLATGSQRGLFPSWPTLVPFTLIAILLVPWLANRRSLARLARLTDLYEAAIARLQHHLPTRPHTGEAFRQPGHLFDRDLNILGPDSLFSLLATTRTGLGQRSLAACLLHAPPVEESLARQQAIQELAPNIALREAIALLGANFFAPTHPETFDTWLAEPPAHFPARLLRPVLVATTLALTALVALALVHRLSWDTAIPNLAALLALQGAVALLYRPRALPILESTAPLPAQLQILADGLALLRSARFQSPLLTRLQHRAADADAPVAALQRLIFLVAQRKTEWFYLPLLLANTGTHTAMRLNAWKLDHAASLHRWLDAWSAFDALNALATYAFEHPANTYPHFLPASPVPVFEADALTHPLLAQPVPNDVRLDPATRFYLISGSNMAGKSTLLRSIGLAAVLARAGAPIPATRARVSPMALGASLTPTDSLAEGKSRFLAEVERLGHILALARTQPTLFLIDELFSGTNSADRLTAARAVLNALLDAGAIGALSTHDLALTSLATPPSPGENRHMASPDPADPLAFDFRLKPGINTTTNALAFIRLLGLDPSA